MGVYFGTTEITNVDWIPGDKDITQAFFGSTEVFTVWAEYDGALPAQYSANGSALADYRIYGASSGVGDETVNLYDKNDPNTIQGAYLGIDGEIHDAPAYSLTYIPAESNATFCVKDLCNANTVACVGFCDANKTIINVVARYINALTDFTTPAQTAYIALSVRAESNANIAMLVHGSTAPASYVPYGYEVDMSVSDGTTSTTTPIYIGSDPLGEDEYVDYGDGKIYRKKENLFIPQVATQNARVVYTDGSVAPLNDVCVSDYIEIDSGKTYTLDIADGNLSAKTGHLYAMYDSNKNFLDTGAHPSVYTQSKYVITVPNGVKYIRFNTLSTAKNHTAFYLGIATLMPTDPLVPLPALPTVDGTTITDYAGQSTPPSRFVAKYRKEGF